MITKFCILHGLEQQIKSTTRVTCSNSTLIDPILTSFPSRVSQKGVIDVGIADRQLIFCTPKISRLKIGGIHKYLNFCLFKDYTVDSQITRLLMKLCRLPQSFSESNGRY